MMSKTKNRRGFTLMEIMACMVIISIVSSITLPAIDNFQSGSRVKADAQLLVSAIRHAKYTALQDNVLIRIIFNEDGSCFKEQVYTADGNEEDATALSSEINTLIGQDYNALLSGSSDSNYEDGTHWSSFDDAVETEFSTSTQVDISEISDGVIYFKPDGYIYTASAAATASKIPETRVIFLHGSAAIAVDINSLGVIASEAFTRTDDDDYSEEEDVVW